MKLSRINQYRLMWIYIFYDLPVGTKKETRAAAQFRNSLLRDGFIMLQFSIYIRPCASRENAEVHVRRAKKSLPAIGSISILTVTDRQFGMMEVYENRKKIKTPSNPGQLELF